MLRFHFMNNDMKSRSLSWEASGIPRVTALMTSCVIDAARCESRPRGQLAVKQRGVDDSRIGSRPRDARSRKPWTWRSFERETTSVRRGGSVQTQHCCAGRCTTRVVVEDLAIVEEAGRDRVGGEGAHTAARSSRPGYASGDDLVSWIRFHHAGSQVSCRCKA